MVVKRSLLNCWGAWRIRGYASQLFSNSNLGRSATTNLV